MKLQTSSDLQTLNHLSCGSDSREISLLITTPEPHCR